MERHGRARRRRSPGLPPGHLFHQPWLAFIQSVTDLPSRWWADRTSLALVRPRSSAKPARREHRWLSGRPRYDGAGFERARVLAWDRGAIRCLALLGGFPTRSGVSSAREGASPRRLGVSLLSHAAAQGALLALQSVPALVRHVRAWRGLPGVRQSIRADDVPGMSPA